MPQTGAVAEVQSFEELVISYFPQDEDGEMYAWSIDDMVNPRIARKFVQMTKPVDTIYGMHWETVIIKRKDRPQRSNGTKNSNEHVETKKGELGERSEGIADLIDAHMADKNLVYGSYGFQKGIPVKDKNRGEQKKGSKDKLKKQRIMEFIEAHIPGPYDNPPNGTVDYSSMFSKGINRRTNRYGTSKTPSKIHGAKSYVAFAAELDKKYERFVSFVRRLYNNPSKRDIALKLVDINASRVGLKQYAELADIVKGDLDLTRKVREGAYFSGQRSYVWESTLIDIQDHLKKTVPRGTEAHVTLYEFGKAAESYRMGRGFSFGNEDLPKDVNGRMEIRFKQGKSDFGISVQLKQNPLTESAIKNGRTLKDMGYSLTIKPL